MTQTVYAAKPSTWAFNTAVSEKYWWSYDEKVAKGAPPGPIYPVSPDANGDRAFFCYNTKNPQRSYAIVATRFASRIVVDDAVNVAYAQRHDGSWFLCATGLACADPTVVVPPPAPPPTPQDVADLVVTLDFGGGLALTFNGRDATDLGDFNGEFRHHKCFALVSPTHPDWRVFFRPECDATGARILDPAAGWRDEIVVEYGRSRCSQAEVVNRLLPYTFTLTKAGAVVYTATVPNHYWYSRFRYQSRELPIVRTDLIARGWIPKFGKSGLFGTTGPSFSVTWPGPMGALPVVYDALQEADTFENYWRNPGERTGIGPLPETCAAVVIFGADAKPAAWRTSRTGAEWMGNLQIYVRDDATLGMPNVRDLTSFTTRDGIGNAGATAGVRYNALYATGNNFDAGPNYPTDFMWGKVVDPVTGKTAQKYPNWICLESGEAHWEAWPNLPWMMTEDTYHLEALHFSINYRILNNAPGRLIEKLPGLFRVTQTRTMAWSLRDITCAVKSTPDAVPKWLQPRSYFKAILDDHLTYALRCVNHPAKIYQEYHAWPVTNNPEAFMVAWLNTIVGQMVTNMGFTEWAPVLEWSIKFHTNMMDGQHGWNRQWCMPYCFSPLDPAPSTMAELMDGLVYPSQIRTQYDARTRPFSAMWGIYKTGDRVPTGLCPPLDAYGKNYLSDGQYPSRNPAFHLDDSEPGWDRTSLIQPDYVAKWHMVVPDTMFYYKNYVALRAALAAAVSYGIPGAQAIWDWFEPQLAGVFNSYGPTHQKKFGRCAFSIDP